MKIIEAYITFICLFVILRLKGIKHYLKYSDDISLISRKRANMDYINSVRKSVDLAARLTLFNADCVYKSLTLAIMLRRRSIPAVVCMGIYSFPFGAHAWVEVNGLVVNDNAKFIRRFRRLENRQHHG